MYYVKCMMGQIKNYSSNPIFKCVDHISKYVDHSFKCVYHSKHLYYVYVCEDTL